MDNGSRSEVPKNLEPRTVNLDLRVVPFLENMAFLVFRGLPFHTQ
jgi:hypothetical protein